MAAHDVLAKWKRNNNDPTKFVLLPQYLLNKQAVEALRKSYEPYLAARAEALKAIPLKTGWYSLNLSLDMSEESFRKNPVPTQVMNVGMYCARPGNTPNPGRQPRRRLANDPGYPRRCPIVWGSAGIFRHFYARELAANGAHTALKDVWARARLPIRCWPRQ